jgi:hypothetical protein
MLNEFVYCQRLFYYEFVEGVFVEMPTRCGGPFTSALIRHRRSAESHG